MTARKFQLESSSGAREVLSSYDAEDDRWKHPLDNRFWSAVKHAHQKGCLGDGYRIAIIDSGCNLEITRLKARVDNALSFVPGSAECDESGHGTAVALLISEVAPRCRIDIYKVVPEGSTEPDEFAIARAIAEAASSEANVVNLSLGCYEALDLSKMLGGLPGNEPVDIADFEADYRKWYPCSCGVCLAASQAAQSGKLLVAAAGNNTSALACPARAQGVISAGFRREERVTVPIVKGGSYEDARAAEASSPEAALRDFSIQEMPGVAGTSFASPLIAGFGALGLTFHELSAYALSKRRAAYAGLFYSMWRQSSGETPAWSPPDIERRYNDALKCLPHIHSRYQNRLGVDSRLMPPEDCAFCGFFAEPLYNDFGLWFMSVRPPWGHDADRLASARMLLEAARSVAPWSPHAEMNLEALNKMPGQEWYRNL